MESKNYSIVTYLVGEDFKKVRAIQKDISTITGSKKCLVDWLPHITVGDGISVSGSTLPEIEDKLKGFCNRQKAITATIKGFGGVDTWKGAVKDKITPYVIWLDVEVSSDLLTLFTNLKDEITSKQETWLPRTISYVPHVTIAFSDLNEEGYRKGLEYLSSKSFETEFSISHIALVECYGEGNMDSVEYKKYYLG